MISTWLYNIITQEREREALDMNLDRVLDTMGNGGQYELTPRHHRSVSIKDNEEFYVKPVLRDVVTRKNSHLFLFSAPGATGKSALAKYISWEKKALLWDLSKERIANHSFSGMLVESLGTKEFSRFTEGLKDGSAVLVIDALDEAEMISGRAAIETLLLDLREAVNESVCPNIALCARTETAHYIRHFFEQEDHKLDISQYEISFFEETSAIEFIKRKISEKREVTPAIEKCVKALFDEIKRLLDYDEDATRSFIGYAPVLEALAVFCDEESNTMQVLQKIQDANCSAEIFQKIMDYILNREHDKVVNGFKERCIEEYSEFDGWENVYSIQEQLVRIVQFVLLGEIDSEAYTANALPRELMQEYLECVRSFIKDHPFLHMFDMDDAPKADFTGPAFRDYVLARIMTDAGTNMDYDDYAQCYFSDHEGNVRFPSQLYFDLYEYCAAGAMKLTHFKYLYDAFKSKERTKFESSVSVEQVEQSVYCTFKQISSGQQNSEYETEFCATVNDEALQVIQLNNAYVDIDGDVILGSAKEDVVISNSTIKCRKLIIQSSSVMFVAEQNGETLVVSSDGIDTSRCPSTKFEVRADRPDLFKVSTPDINNWYKLHKYNYSLEDDNDLDTTKFWNAVWAILKHFRKHRKDAPGKHREYIDNIVVGKSKIKSDVLSFFVSRGVIYQDAKDLKQYKLNNSALEDMGIYWDMLSAQTNSGISTVMSAYIDWKQIAEKK